MPLVGELNSGNTASREPQVSRENNNLGQAITQLEETVVHLENSLHAVLRDPAPQSEAVSDKGQVPEALVPVAQSISDSTERVATCCRLINGIIGRLEV